MKTLPLILVALIAVLAGAGAGYWRGHADGAAAQQARQDRQTVQDLNGIIESHTELITKANDASRAMRAAMTRREAADRKTTEELHHALASTADSRADCAFPADVLRQLQAARERAFHAAAGGIRGALPSAAASAANP